MGDELLILTSSAMVAHISPAELAYSLICSSVALKERFPM